MDSTDEVALDWDDVAVVDYCLALYFSAICFDKEPLPHVAGPTPAAVLHSQPRPFPVPVAPGRSCRARVQCARAHGGAVAVFPGEPGRHHRSALALRPRRGRHARGVFARHRGPWPAGLGVGLRRGRACAVRARRADRGHARPLAPQGESEDGFRPRRTRALCRDARVVAALRARVLRLRQWSAKGARARVFSLSQQESRRLFAGACAELGLPAETPHVLRHTAAAELWASGQVTLAELMLRGRWQSESSAKRYTKPHLLAAHESKAPPAVLELGKAFWTDPASFVARGRRVAARQYLAIVKN